MFCTKCQKFQPLFDVKHYCQLCSCLILAGRLIAFCNYVNQFLYGRVDLYVRRYPASRVASIFPSKIEGDSVRRVGLHSSSAVPCEQWFLQAGRYGRETTPGRTLRERNRGFSPVASGLEKPLLAGWFRRDYLKCMLVFKSLHGLVQGPVSRKSR